MRKHLGLALGRVTCCVAAICLTTITTTDVSARRSRRQPDAQDPQSTDPPVPPVRWPLEWPLAYGTLGAAVATHTWRATHGPGSSADEAGVGGGFYAAGYLCRSPRSHLGGYLTYGRSGWPHNRHEVSLGPSVKYGWNSGRIWLGATIDGGMLIEIDTMGSHKRYFGLRLAPWLELQVLTVGRGPFSSSILVAVGAVATPFINAYAGWAWEITPTVVLGATFGGRRAPRDWIDPPPPIDPIIK